MILDKLKTKKKTKVQEWEYIKRNILIPTFIERGVKVCELRLMGCLGGAFTGFAHRHKRVSYYRQPEMLGNLNQVVLACSNCHQKIENDKNLTKEIFFHLRGRDLLDS